MSRGDGAAGTPRIGVLALQGDFEAHARALREAGAEPVPVRLPAHLDGIAGLVIPGGESTTLLKLAGRDGMFEALRDFARAMPVFGTCAGCILLARRVRNPEQQSLAALDATVERNAYGRQTESAILETPTALPGGPLETVYIRAPRIAGIGPGVEVLAERDGAPVLVREGRLLAATFHPELSADRRVHRLFLDIAAASGCGAERAA